ncbi:MAG: hypothetical protein AAGF97_07230 [Planctomycetota bacterium]
MPSLRSKRGRFLFASVATLLGALAVTLTSPQRNEILVPGGLTTAHAQILRQQGTRRCATCHERGAQTLAQWAWASTASFLAAAERPVGPTQTELCMDCHDQTLPRQWAVAPHTVDPIWLVSQPKSDPPSVTAASAALSELACATCHREHHGSDYDLTTMTAQQCNVCHQAQCTGFAEDHPDFGDWPYARRPRIRFTHAAHQARYFPEGDETFACVSCHQASDGSIVRSIGFQTACGKCHESSIQQSFAEGVEIINFPLLDVELLADNGLGVGGWPDAATGDFDGGLTPLVRLLLAADPEAQRSLLGPSFDLMDVDPEDLEQLEAISDLVWAYKRLLHQLATANVPELQRRLFTISTPTSADPSSSQPMIEALVRQLPYEVLAQSIRAALPELHEELPPVAADTAATGTAAAGASWNDQRAVQDEITAAVLIPPEGHASPFVQAWIELNVAFAGPDDTRENLLARVGTAGDCLRCHTVDRTPDGLVVNWRPTGAAQPAFTRFQHGPHRVLPELQDCTTCHQLEPQSDQAVYDGFAFAEGDHAFAAMSRARCATCHNRQTKVDQCTLCHSYHALGGAH